MHKHILPSSSSCTPHILVALQCHTAAPLWEEPANPLPHPTPLHLQPQLWQGHTPVESTASLCSAAADSTASPAKGELLQTPISPEWPGWSQTWLQLGTAAPGRENSTFGMGFDMQRNNSSSQTWFRGQLRGRKMGQACTDSGKFWLHSQNILFYSFKHQRMFVSAIHHLGQPALHSCCSHDSPQELQWI